MKNFCSCLTKTPNIEDHLPDCLYRLELEGYEAFGKGLPPEDCPYPKGSLSRTAWMDGYITADAQESGDYE